jgi:hypothetical protein
MNTGTQDTQLGRRRFRIWIDGRLDQRFADTFEGVELAHSPEGSILDGVLVDQSHLRGVVDRLWQLGIEVLRFETYLPDREESPSAAADKEIT